MLNERQQIRWLLFIASTHAGYSAAQVMGMPWRLS
jgi:hypothetical protein